MDGDAIDGPGDISRSASANRRSSHAGVQLAVTQADAAGSPVGWRLSESRGIGLLRRIRSRQIRRPRRRRRTGFVTASSLLRPSPCAAASRKARPTITRSRNSFTTRSICAGRRRRGSALRERTGDADGHRAAQTHQTGRRRNRLGDSGLQDVQNNVSITSRRGRAPRAATPTCPPPSPPGNKDERGDRVERARRPRPTDRSGATAAAGVEFGVKKPKTPGSVAAQGDHRVDACRANRRHRTGQPGYSGQCQPERRGPRTSKR